jgi:hypothetical protein
LQASDVGDDEMKTTIELAREAGLEISHTPPFFIRAWEDELKAFADLVRADAIAGERNSWPAEMEAMEQQVNILTDALAAEREACAELVYNSPPSDEYESPLKAVYDAIRARGNT